MRISTKTGDRGETDLLAGPRVLKNHLRVEAYGALDELNALLGLARAEPLPPPLDRVLGRVQHQLFDAGAELACPHPEAYGLPVIQTSHVAALEHQIVQFEAVLPPLQHFILPGGAKTAALLHVARTVCRRAERRIVALREAEPEHVSENVIQFLNRLGDLLFLMARAANRAAGVADVAWTKATPPE